MFWVLHDYRKSMVANDNNRSLKKCTWVGIYQQEKHFWSYGFYFKRNVGTYLPTCKFLAYNINSKKN